jgi:hypothetical protein
MQGARETIRRCRPVVVFEARWPSSGVYGPTPDGLFRFVTNDLGLKLALMIDWLSGRGDRPFTEEQFVWHWNHGPDYYFIAHS